MIHRLAIALALAALFWIANRGAYKGFFSGDDLDTIYWTQKSHWSDFARGVLSPRLHESNFRPTAHTLYQVWTRTFGLHYPPYVATVQAIHLLNALLLFWLLRRLKFGEWPSLAGVLFWVFHLSLYDTFWKPMYVYDVLCGTFALVTLLAWTADLYIPAVLAFWLAIKAKEHAIFLPPVLLAYEYWLGGKRWKRLTPFFAISVLFGVQALLQVRPADHPYRFEFSPRALWQTIPFYAPGLLVLPFVWVSKDKRSWFGLALLAAMIATLFFLPGRKFNAYLYVPLLGLAICVAAWFERTPRAVGAVAIVVWLAVCFFQMRNYRRAELTFAAENRTFFEQMKSYGPTLTEAEVYAADSPPVGLSWWGVSAIIRILSGKHDATVFPSDWTGLREKAKGKAVVQLAWNPATRKLFVISRDTSHPEPAYIDFKAPAPFWLMGDGWYKQEGDYRWTRTRADLTLRRPAQAGRFQLLVNINRAHIEAVKQVNVKLELDGNPFGVASFSRSGWQTRTWPVPPQTAGSRVKVNLEIQPPFHPENDPRELGIAVGAIGFPDSPR